MNMELSPAYTALVLYALWTLLLLLGVVGYRGVQVLSGQKGIDAFPADREHGGPDWYRRLNRAHLNCVENLPVFAALVIVAGLAGRLELANTLAPWILAGRVAQSLLHLLTVFPWVIWLRVSALALQVVLCAVLGLGLLGLV